MTWGDWLLLAVATIQSVRWLRGLWTIHQHRADAEAFERQCRDPVEELLRDVLGENVPHRPEVSDAVIPRAPDVVLTSGTSMRYEGLGWITYPASNVEGLAYARAFEGEV